MSKVTRVLVCIVFTPCFCFATSVCFGSFENLSLSCFSRDWCRFPSRKQPYTSICSSNFFCEIDVCVYPPLFWLCLLSGILAPHDSNIDCHALRLLPILYCVYIYIYATIVYIRHYFISWRYLVRCSATVIACQITQLLRFCEKDNLCSLLDSGRQIFHWSKLTLLSPWVQPWVRGRSSGSFPEQWLVIEPKDNQPPNK